MKIQKPRKVMVLTTIESHHCSKIFAGIGKYCQIHSPWQIHTVHIDPEGENTSNISEIKRFKPEGIIIILSDVIKEIVKPNIPTIAWSSYRFMNSDLPAIFIDADATMLMGIEHLRSRGYKRFAYCGYKQGLVSSEFEQSFRNIIGENNINHHGFIFMVEWVLTNTFWNHEHGRIVKWLKSLPKPIGILTIEDIVAEQILRCCNLAGIDVPEQVAVLGSGNNNIICTFCNPPLSSLEFANEKAGYEIAALLDRLMDGTEKMKGQNISVMPSYIVTRKSTDITVVDDPQVAEVLKFIRDNIRHIKQITDITQALAINRRSLEYKFKKLLNHSILDEIRRVRADKAAQMLIETNLPISQIAEILGYSSKIHFWRCFNQEKKMSPAEFRKKTGYKN